MLTLAYSIFNVQQPAYMSAPSNCCLALCAEGLESNLFGIKE